MRGERELQRERFERVHEACWGGKIRDRGLEPYDETKSDPADFLGRLWSLFGGPADPCDDGFSYTIRDRQTGLVFTAYSGPSGPAYGGAPMERHALREVLDAFDALLDATPLADCEHAFALDPEYGGGRARIGVANGRRFFRTER